MYCWSNSVSYCCIDAGATLLQIYHEEPLFKLFFSKGTLAVGSVSSTILNVKNDNVKSM